MTEHESMIIKCQAPLSLLFGSKPHRLQETRGLTDGVDVRRQRSQRPALVLLDGLWRVKLRDVIVRIHGNKDVGYKSLGEEGERLVKANVSCFTTT